MIGVAYSESNQLGGGIRDPGDAGLTRFGRDAVRRMNRLGIAIDVSHTGDVTAMQTCEASQRSGLPVALGREGVVPRAQAQDRRPAAGGRRHRRRDRGRGLAAHHDHPDPPAPRPRGRDGARRVLHRRDGHRPRRVRPRHVLRRPRRAASRVRRLHGQRRGTRARMGRPRRGTRERERVPERDPVARRARLLRRAHRASSSAATPLRALGETWT